MQRLLLRGIRYQLCNTYLQKSIEKMNYMHMILLTLLSSVMVRCTTTYEAASGSAVLIKAVNITTKPVVGNVSYYAPGFYLYSAATQFQGYDSLLDKVYGAISIAVFSPCQSSLSYVTNWGEFQEIATPVVQMVDASFSASLGYYRENLTYVIDFCRDMSSSCASKNGDNYCSAPTASFPGSLASSQYGAYDIATQRWLLQYDNCSTIHISSNTSFADMLSCKSGTGYCVNVSSILNTPFIEYSGSLFISMMQNSEVVRKWEYPFVYRFNSISTVLSSQSVKNQVTFSVSSYIGVSGVVIKIKSITSSPTGYLSNANIPSLFSLPITPSNSQTQQWEFLSNLDSLSGRFEFSWMLNPEGSTIAITVQTSMQKQPTVSTSYSLNTALKFYKDSSYSVQSVGPFGVSDSIFVASVYEAPEQLYTLKILNAWLCYPDYDSLIPEYDPARNLFGCKVATISIPQQNIIQMYSNGEVNNNETRVTISKSSISIINSKQASGFSIKVNPTAFSEDRVLYVHLETLLIPKQRGRTIFQDTVVAADLKALFLERKNQVADLTRTSYILITLIALIIPLFICIILIYCLYIKCKLLANTKKRKNELNHLIALRAACDGVRNGNVEHIDDILNNKELLQKYVPFCNERHVQESLMFCLMMQDYRNLQGNTSAQGEKFKELFNKFLAKGAPYELNITSEMRLNALTQLADIEAHAKMMLTENTFKSFKAALLKEYKL
jgi:Regulator of G protein signaling domain